MSKLLPFRSPDRARRERAPRLVDLDDEAADEVFDALSSETARTILERLYQDPATASDVAEAADTSLQNARYHLDKLEDAGLIEPVDTWYSSRGTEMTVYGPTNEPLVVAAGEEEATGALRAALQRVVGALGVLALASLVVQRLFGGEEPGRTIEASSQAETGAKLAAGGATETSTPAATGTPTPAATEAATSTPVPEATPVPTATEAAPEAARIAETTAASPGPFEVLGSAPPGAVFFAGGLLVLGLAAGYWYLGERRPY